MPLRFLFAALLLSACALSTHAVDLTAQILLESPARTSGTSSTWLVVFNQDVQTATVQSVDFTLDAGGVTFGTVSLAISEITSSSYRVVASWTNGTAEGAVALTTSPGFSVTTATSVVTTGLIASGPTVTVDHTAPHIISINTTGLGSVDTLDMTFQVAFSEAIDPTTITTSDFIATGTSNTEDTTIEFPVDLAPVLVTQVNPSTFNVQVTGTSVTDLTGTVELQTSGTFAVADVAGNIGSGGFAEGQTFSLVAAVGQNNLNTTAFTGKRPVEVAVGGNLDFTPTPINAAGETFSLDQLNPAVFGIGSSFNATTGRLILRDIPAQTDGYLDFAILAQPSGTVMPILIKVVPPPISNN